MKSLNAKKAEWMNAITSVQLNSTLSYLKVLNGLGKNECNNNFTDNLKIGSNENLVSTISKETGYYLRKDNNKLLDNVLTDSISVSIANLNNNNMELLTKINSIDLDIVSRTPNIWRNVNVLGWIADCHNTFINIIIACYEIFYEGIGNRIYNDPLYINKFKINFNDKIALFHIKKLRLNECHDINHGDCRDIEKKREDIEDIYLKFISKKTPVSVKDYKEIQFKLYSEINEWLLYILDFLNKCSFQDKC